MTFLLASDKFMQSVVGALREADYPADAFRVGGSVRDEIMGGKPKDGDYVVTGVPLDVLGGQLTNAAGPNRSRTTVTKLELRTGQHSGWRVFAPGMGSIEIMLPRTDTKASVEGGNERHQFTIEIDHTLPISADAVRRDVTMNAIYRDVMTGTVHDPLGGRHDIHDELLRITHTDSFRDDPLRILRVARFVATLGFDVEQVTRLCMQESADAVTGLTAKGVSGTAKDEFFKMLMGDHVAKALRLLRDTGVLSAFIPEIAPMLGHDPQNDHHSFTTDEHTFIALDAAARMGLSLRVRLSILFHDSGKPAVEWIGDDGMKHFYESSKVPGSRDHAYASAELFLAFARRVDLPRDLTRDVPVLIERHMVPLSLRVKATKVRKWRCEIGDEMLADLLKHRLCDVMGKGDVNYDDLRAIARMEQIREDAVRDGIPASPKDMKDMGLIDGKDLIDMGVPREQIGDVLRTILHEVVSNPDRMIREWALKRAAKLGGVAVS